MLLLKSLLALSEIIVTTKVSVRSEGLLSDGLDIIFNNAFDTLHEANQNSVLSHMLELQQSIDDIVTTWG